MIVALITIAIAFAWLLKETDGLTVRLESTEYQRAELKRQAKRDFGSTALLVGICLIYSSPASDTEATPRCGYGYAYGYSQPK